VERLHFPTGSEAEVTVKSRGQGGQVQKGVPLRDQNLRQPSGAGRYAFEKILWQESPALSLVNPDPP